MSHNSTTIAPQPGIMEISLYQGGASKVAGARAKFTRKTRKRWSRR